MAKRDTLLIKTQTGDFYIDRELVSGSEGWQVTVVDQNVIVHWQKVGLGTVQESVEAFTEACQWALVKAISGMGEATVPVASGRIVATLPVDVAEFEPI